MPTAFDGFVDPNNPSIIYLPDDRPERTNRGKYAAMAAMAAGTVGLGLTSWQMTPKEERAKPTRVAAVDSTIPMLTEGRAYSGDTYSHFVRGYPDGYSKVSLKDSPS